MDYMDNYINHIVPAAVLLKKMAYIWFVMQGR